MDVLAAYIKDLSRVRVLKNEEAAALMPKVRAGDKDARNQLIESCLKLAFLKVKQFSKSGIIDDEFITEANIAVCQSVDHWDGATAKLSSYVGRAIEHALSNAHRKKHIVYVPQWADRKAYVLSQSKEPISPEDQKLCEHVAKAKTASSLSGGVYCDEEGNTCSCDPIEDAIIETEVAEQREELLNLVNRKQTKYRRILIRYYGLCGYKKSTLKEICQELEISKTTASLRLKRGLQLLQQHRKCAVCGKPFDLQKNGRGGEFKKTYCSTKCKGLARRKHPELLKERPCKQCGKMFKPHTYTSLFCDYECYKKWRQHTEKQSRIKHAICKYCKTEFMTKRSDQLYCGIQCQGKDRTRRMKEKKNELIEAVA